jgi:hypothetical protein
MGHPVSVCWSMSLLDGIMMAMTKRSFIETETGDITASGDQYSLEM